MFNLPPEIEKPNIEDLKISELTVAQFRRVFQECLDEPRKQAAAREAIEWQLYRRGPGKPVW
jgi:hypothetical protein